MGRLETMDGSQNGMFFFGSLWTGYRSHLLRSPCGLQRSLQRALEAMAVLGMAMWGPNIFKKYLEIWRTRKVSIYIYIFIFYFFFDTTSTNFKAPPYFCKTTPLSKISDLGGPSRVGGTMSDGSSWSSGLATCLAFGLRSSEYLGSMAIFFVKPPSLGAFLGYVLQVDEIRCMLQQWIC